jgi:hypothetical protein
MADGMGILDGAHASFNAAIAESIARFVSPQPVTA